MESVYLETTIPSYLTSRQSRDIIILGRQEITKNWWKERSNKFSIYISTYVIDESGFGDKEAAKKRNVFLETIPVLAVDDEVLKLASEIIKAKIIPPKAATDASHIAVATRHGIDYLLTWNCTHIANAEIMRKIEKVMNNNGYEIPVICTPDELMGGDYNDI